MELTAWQTNMIPRRKAHEPRTIDELNAMMSGIVIGTEKRNWRGEEWTFYRDKLVFMPSSTVAVRHQ